jgi:vacuolar iron transporter family protein
MSTPPANPETAPSKLLLQQLTDERNGAALYRLLSDAERDPKLAEVYRRMAGIEERHAEALSAQLTQAGVPIPAFLPSFRTRALGFLARKLGVSAVLPSVSTAEQLATHSYSASGDAAKQADEQSHARILKHLTGNLRGMEGGMLAQIEGRHRSAGGNAVRAAVLGANDGLVSNLSLVMGVAGAGLSNSSILTTGLAGLLAGAASMALGEWLSVQSSRELTERQIGIERVEVATRPAEELEELALIYQARGLSEARAHEVAQQIMSDEKTAAETLAREELGLDPESLGGSAWEAAITSFILFAIGAVIPVLPFMFASDFTAIVISAAFSTVGLFAIGAAITLFTGRTVLFSGMRQVIFGLIAAAITFGIGRLIGVNLA